MISKKDIEVKINPKTRQVFFDDNFLGLNGENLQGNIVFSFIDGNFVDGMAILEIEQDGKKYYIMPLDKENETYKLVIKSSLLTTSQILMQLVIVEDENSLGTPKFKSKTFHMNVYESINATETIPDQYPSLEGLIKEALEIIVKDGDGDKFLSDDGTYREIQGAGTTNYEKLKNKPKINNVELDGDKSLDELGIQPKGNYLTKIPEEYINEEEFSELTKDFATKEFVGNEISKIENIIVVNELPATGVPNKIYFVPKADTQTQDLFDEYVWINGKWEWITTKQIEVDLSNYYNKEEIDEALSNVDLSDYYNKEETNELIDNIPLEIVYISDYTSQTNLDIISKAITKWNTTQTPFLICDVLHSSTAFLLKTTGTQPTIFTFIQLTQPTYHYIGKDRAYRGDITVYGSWENDKFICSRMKYTSENMGSPTFLGVINTTEYTPTADYHPATKKYVDDSVANVDVDLTDYYTKNEVDEALSNVEVDLTDYYNKTEVNELLENLDVDLTDYYTKDETDQKITENVGDINTVLATLVSVVADEEEY